MKDEILSNLENPRQLEKLYREHKSEFNREFNLLYPQIHDQPVSKTWFERLNFESDEISWGTRNDLVFVIVISLLAGLVAKIPHFTSLTEEFFYPRNLSFIVFPFLTAYFIRAQSFNLKKIIVTSSIFLASLVYINMLPDDRNSDTLVLACIHLPLLLWAVTGTVFLGDQLSNTQRRLDFLRYNGDLVVMAAVIVIAGGILSAVTIGLFELIDIRIEQFYFENVVIWGAAAVPLVGTYLVRSNPQLVNKVSPVIATVFTPLVLVMLVIYLSAVIYTGKDPYNDREFLMIFNLLLIGVMALILFSVAEKSKSSVSKRGTTLLLGLAVVTIVVNSIALSAIVFRITEWGITPNRLAVLGANILMLIHLVLVAGALLKGLKKTNTAGRIENIIASYLPVYILWTIFVTFFMPALFNFK